MQDAGRFPLCHENFASHDGASRTVGLPRDQEAKILRPCSGVSAGMCQSQ